MYKISAISSLNDDTYDTFLDQLKGKFLKAKNNNKQKSALVRFWKNRDHVSLKGASYSEETLSPFERCL